jgi:hypothetical protein
MAIRRQTVALLVLLLGVGLLSLLHHRHVETVVSEPSLPPNYEPTPAQVHATFAAIRTPKRFRRSNLCFLGGKDEMCMVRFPSIPLSLARITQLLSESGLVLRGEPLCATQERPLPQTHTLYWMTCNLAMSSVGKAQVLFSAHSLVQSSHGRLLGTTQSWAEKGGHRFEGTVLDFRDYGVPRQPTHGKTR